MQAPGFILCVDEAGDEGIERVRPIDENGGSEYFILAGVLYSADRADEINSFIDNLKSEIGIPYIEPIHFRDLSDRCKLHVLNQISAIKLGIVCIASNKRNMRGYRNRRVEAANTLWHKGRRIVPNMNWFYNNLLRYLVETATFKCGDISDRFRLRRNKISMIISYRRGFSYIQTRNYFRKLAIESRPRGYFNNKFRPRFDALDIDGITALRDHQHPGLQLADCVASAVYQAFDASTFQSLKPEYLRTLSSHFLDQNGEVRGFGFKFLPDPYLGPLTTAQRTALKHVGYTF